MMTEKKMFGYKVNILKECVYTNLGEDRYADYEEDLDGQAFIHVQEERWSEKYENSFDSIQMTQSSPDVVSTIDLYEAEGYLVWLDYTTGDSFGSAERGSTECVAILSTMAAAEELKDYLKLWSPDTLGWEQKENFHFETQDGQRVEYKTSPWGGFEECLCDVYIEKVKLKSVLK